MISQMLRYVTCLFVMLSGLQAAQAQDKLEPAPVKLPERATQIDTVALQQQRFLNDVAQSVVYLEADGERTMDAIENSQITLTLGIMTDTSRLSVLCNNSGKPLGVVAQSLAGSLHLQGKVSETLCTGKGRDDDPFVIKFRLHRESGNTSLFYEQPPELLFVIVKPAEDDLEEEATLFNRRESQPPNPQPVTLDLRRSQISHSVVRLSQGWTPVKLPDAVHTDSAFGTFDSTVTFADEMLTTDRKLMLKRDKVEVAELPAFEQWMELIRSDSNVALRSTLYYPNRDASAGTDAQKKAADLIDEAYRDIESHELDKADTALKQAESVDPGHEIIHENRGELAAARGDYSTALAEYRKELEAYPNALIEMGSIAGAQRKLGDSDGATATLQRWMLADTNSGIAATSLMNQYHDMGRDDLAARVGDDAMNIMTRDAKRGVDFLLAYGREQMLAGQAAQAKNTLEVLLDLTEDDNIVNDAAYYLSEQGLSLDRAESSVREALTQFDPDNSASALSISYADGSTERTSLLLSTWDTLGWILYKKGAIEEAETYIRAAWRNKQDIAISRHLGEIFTAEDKPVDAMDVYTLGLESIADKDAVQMAKDPDAIAVRDALDHLKQNGNATTVKDPKAALLALRTLDLGPAKKPRAKTSCSASLTTSELEIEIPGSDDPIMLSNGKLLEEFFPPESKVTLNRKGTIQCSKTCSLVFAP